MVTEMKRMLTIVVMKSSTLPKSLKVGSLMTSVN